MVNEIKKIEAYIDEKNRINKDTKINEILSLSYNEIVLNIGSLKRLVAFGRSIREKYYNYKIFDEKIRTTLLFSDKSKISNILKLIKEKNYLNLDLSKKLEDIDHENILDKKNEITEKSGEIFHLLEELSKFKLNKNTNFADIYSLNNSLKDLIEQNTIVETESQFLEKISLNLKFVNKSELEIYEQSVSF